MSKKRSEKSVKINDIKKLLNEQTSVILSVVDAKITSLNKKLSITELNILSEVDKKLVRMEIRINQKIEKLTTTLDNFLKRLTDMEDEFTIMKLDINRMKKIIREKLGVDLL